jgi:hypothetical protein
MWLDDEQWARFRDRVVVKACPLCGAEGLEASRAATLLAGPPVKPGLRRPNEARLKVSCRSCGYIMEFESAAFGIHAPAT